MVGLASGRWARRWRGQPARRTPPAISIPKREFITLYVDKLCAVNLEDRLTTLEGGAGMNSALGTYVLRFERNPENVATAVLCHILRSSEDAQQLLLRWMNRTGAEPLPDNLDFIDQLEKTIQAIVAWISWD